MSRALEAIPVIDMDSHYTEPPDLWTSRAPAKFRDLVPHVVRNANDDDVWMMGDGVEVAPLGFTVVRANGDKVDGTFSLPHFEDIHPGSYDMGERLKFLDQHGLAAQILYPNVAGFGSNRFTLVKDNDLRRISVQIYNDAVAEMQQASGGRLFPQAVVPFWNIDDTLAELKRVKRLGLTGIVGCDAPEAFGHPTLDSPHWEPFWAACEELDLPVNFHLGSGSLLRPQPWETMSLKARGATSTITSFLNNARAMVNVIFTGIVRRHPGLKVVSVESGIGWVPYVLEAMEYQFDEVIPADERATWGGLRPRDLFRRNFSVSFWFEKLGPTKLIEEIGEDNVMFETDFPHPTCLYPGARQHLLEVMASVPERVQRKVLHDNPVRVYNLPA